MWYVLFRSLFRVFFALVYRLEARGQENIPAYGPVILCANHISNLDPPLVGSPVSRKVHYMAKEELFQVPVIGWLITRFGAFPVKRGGVSKESIRLSVQLLKDGNMLGIFPEGSRKNAGGIAKKGAANLAFRSGATVIPAAIIGNYRPFCKMRIIYGSPVDISEFAEESSADASEKATEKIMVAIRDLIAQFR